MKTIIAGSRWVTDIEVVRQAIDSCPWTITEVVSGCCRGVDRLGEQLAREAGVPITPMPADWNKHGNVAGPLRNRAMADYAEALIAVWDGLSRGTANMITKSRARGLRIHVHSIPPEPMEGRR